MKDMEQTMQMIREHLPAPGTELGCYTFLSQDTLWTGTVESNRPFVVVAEDSWNMDSLIMLVMADGPVYIAEYHPVDDAKQSEPPTSNPECCQLLCYCAADFPKFMSIMHLYQTTLHSFPDSESLFDEEDYEQCKKAEKFLREQIEKIDPSALEDPESLWSTLLEELGAGM